MGARTFIFLSSLVLVIKCYVCQSIAASSISLSETIGQSSLPNQFTVPAVIKPVITYDTSNLVPTVPNYNSLLPTPQPPMPIVIDNACSSNGGSNNIFNLLLLLSLLKNNKKGGNTGCNGCGGCSGCCNRYYSNPYSIDYNDGIGDGYYDPIYYPPQYDTISTPVAEITVNSGGYIDEPVLPSYSPYTYPVIQANPGSDLNEIILTIRTDYAPRLAY